LKKQQPNELNKSHLPKTARQPPLPRVVTKTPTRTDTRLRLQKHNREWSKTQGHLSRFREQEHGEDLHLIIHFLISIILTT
jgi:hypothetical protein